MTSRSRNFVRRKANSGLDVGGVVPSQVEAADGWLDCDEAVITAVANLTQPAQLPLHPVEVVELNPPKGEQGVRWLLLTTEPIDSADQVLQIVEWYRRRWLVEAYFKALKSGCLIEERQMESASNMLRILALLAPAAWRLLLLRAIATDAPTAHGSCVVSQLEFTLLAKRLPKARLRADATVEQVLRAVAKLGGHLPRNGRPGW